MNTTYFKALCGLIILGLLVTGCSERDDPFAPTPEPDPVELEVQLGMTITDDYVPFRSVTIPMVTGGSGEYSYELYRQGELVGNNPIEALLFDEPGTSLIKLKVIDMVTGQADSSSVMVAGQSAPPGLPLETRLYIPETWGYSPLTFVALGLARGGTPPYSYEMIVNDEVIAETDILHYQLYELGQHEVVFRATDANGDTKQSSMPVWIAERPTEPLMRINFQALPPQAYVDQRIGLVTTVYGGQPPFQFEIKVDGQIISTEPTVLYQIPRLGEQMAEVKVTDATGMTSETVARFTGEERYVYVPETTIDATVDNQYPRKGEVSYFHGDARGPCDSIVWTWTNLHYPDPMPLGTGEDVEFEFDFGPWLVKAEAFYQGASVAWDTVSVHVMPPIPPVGPTVDLTSDNYRDYPPFYFTLHSDIDVGDAPIVSIEYRMLTEDGWSHPIPNDNEEDYNGIVYVPGEETYSVTVTDANGLTGTDVVTLTGLEVGALSFNEEMGIWAGPGQTTDSTTLDHSPPEAMMRYYLRGLFVFDVHPDDRAPMVLEFRYSDSSSFYWTIPDLNPERPSEVLIHLGEAPIEQGMEIIIHYTGNIYEKCNGRNEFRRLYGDRESNKANDEGIVITGSSQRPDCLKR